MHNKVTINADDFGIDENRTKAILESFRIGAITQTTAMVNMPYFKTAVRMLREQGLLNKMGLHFNLTEGPAMTDAMRKCRFFCDSDGNFTAAFHHTVKYRFFIPSECLDILRGEAEAQIRAFVDSGATFMHLDSHHHVHTDLAVARILFPIAKRHGFRTVRLSRNFGVGLSASKRLYKWYFNSRLVPQIGPASDYFTTFGDFQSQFASIPTGSSVEVMVHPMFGQRGNLSLSAPLTDSGYPMQQELDFYKSALEADPLSYSLKI